MSENKTQWMKRVNIAQQIYSYLIYPIRDNKYLEVCAEKYNFDLEQLKVIEYFLANKNEIKSSANKYIKTGWEFERLNVMEQAIIYGAVSESKALNTDKNIIINESVKTAKNFCDENSYEFINAILDKLI